MCTYILCTYIVHTYVYTYHKPLEDETANPALTKLPFTMGYKKTKSEVMEINIL